MWHRSCWKVSVAALVIVVLAGCAAASDWRSPHYQEHALVGTVWDVPRNMEIDPAIAEDRLTDADFVLLGETHDNPDHHVLQARLIAALTEAARRPAVAFEMFSVGQQQALDAHLEARPLDAAGIGPALGWDKTGWPDWDLYQPVAEAALAAGLSLEAANADRTTVRQLAMGESGSLDPALANRLALDVPIPIPVAEALGEEIEAAHCGYAPAAMIDGMVQAQWARDAHMAARLAELDKTGSGHGAVLIAGTGHTRHDRGVPLHLERLRPSSTITSIGFLEVRPGADRLADYATPLGADRLPFDIVWFTPRIDDRDACERFKDSLEAMKHPKTSEDAAD